VLQANILTAMLAGFWARAADGHPGAQVLSEGLRLLETLVWYQKKIIPQAHPKRKRRNPT
jgi:hypothetical protein